MQSGRKIVTKDGVTKYYAADGVELEKDYFENLEGKVDVRQSGRYSVTKNGKTRYYAADGTELNESYFKQAECPDVIVGSGDKKYNLNKTIEKRINSVTTKLENAEGKNGFLGSAWSGFKNLTGTGAGSDKVRELQTAEQKLLEQFNANPQRRAEIFKELTGAEYSEENLEKFIKGEIKLKSEQALDEYSEGQEMAVDIAADMVSGIAAFGIYTVAIGGALFTGGASIPVGIAVAAVSGAAIKTGLKAADAASGGREYTMSDAGYDAATGAFSGVLAPATGGTGGAVGKTVATRLGIQTVKTIGKEAAEEAVEAGVQQTFKQGIKTALTNPSGYEYVGGTFVQRATATGAEMVTDGALSGGIDNAFRTAINGGSAEDVLQAAGEGFVGGAIMSPIIGGGMKATGKAVGKTVKGARNAAESSVDNAADAPGSSVARSADDVAPTPIFKQTFAELKETIASGKKVTQNTDIPPKKGKLAVEFEIDEEGRLVMTENLPSSIKEDARNNIIRGYENILGINKENVVLDLIDDKIDIEYAAAVLRDIDELNLAFKLAEKSGVDKVRLNTVKQKLIEQVNANIADHGSIVMQSYINPNRFKVDPETGIRYMHATRDDIFLVHAVYDVNAASPIEWVIKHTQQATDDIYLSASLINKHSSTFDGYKYGVILDNSSVNVTSAGYGQISDYQKNFLTFAKHSNYRYKGIEESSRFIKNSFLQKLEEKGIHLSDEEYVQLFNKLRNIQYFNQITESIIINGKRIDAKTLRDAVEESNIDLVNMFINSLSNNEITTIPSGVRGIFARVDDITEIPTDVTDIAKKNNLGIILLGRYTPDSKNNPNYIPDKYKARTTSQRNTN